MDEEVFPEVDWSTLEAFVREKGTVGVYAILRLEREQIRVAAEVCSSRRKQPKSPMEGRDGWRPVSFPSGAWSSLRGAVRAVVAMFESHLMRERIRQQELDDWDMAEREREEFQRRFHRLKLAELTRLRLPYWEELGAEMAVSVTLNLDDDVPDVRGDPSALLSVLDEIVKNAINASEKNQSVVIGAKAVESSVKITVTDSGSGILIQRHKELLSNFFSDLYGADPGGTSSYLEYKYLVERRRAGESKLGLAISTCLAFVMRGSIDLSGSFGQGTTCTIRLPRFESPE